ncbi:MAG: arginine--tRNA ligase, partial [Hyphomicrobiales bacterium]|nr:arginine--tRNA ligase [Hyphomicrobiales bacterium]
MNPFADIAARVREALQSLAAEGRLPKDLDLGRFSVEPPRDPAHGDVSTNAAMVYAPEAKTTFGAPRKLAEALADRLAAAPGVASAEIAGPGFINLRLAPTVFEAALKAALSDPARFGAGARTGRRVDVEYVSANPTGPLHIGHARGAAYGDALARLLALAGDEVTKEFYVNDAGAQVDALARSAFLRYREALGETIGAIPEGLYPGDYLKPVGAGLAAKFGRALLDMPETERHAVVRDFAIEAMLDAIRADLARLGIVHDVFFSERSLHAQAADGGANAVLACIETLRAHDLVHVGRLPPPKGQPQEDWEDREQTLFRSTLYGDDVDRPLLKSDGSFTYFASDIAYHADKVARGFDRLVDVLGADHGGYAKRIGASVKALSGGRVAFDVKFCQLVRLMRAGEPVKMSKRAGEFVTLAEVVDEVGPDAVRFMLLTRRNDAPLDFDLDKVI